jgi:hypothetical protein
MRMQTKVVTYARNNSMRDRSVLLQHIGHNFWVKVVNPEFKCSQSDVGDFTLGPQSHANMGQQNRNMRH